jgi:transcriptional antiterminator RfaH
MSNWYTVYCKPQQDARAEEHLRNQSYEVFRPLVRVRRRYGVRIRQAVESMFPRYLFIQLNDVSEWAPIRSTRGVAGLLRWGAYTPRVPEPVILDLRQRTDVDHCIELETDDFQPNDRIRITDGPFTGYEALFDSRSGEERVSVLLEIMQRTQRLMLPEQAIEYA